MLSQVLHCNPTSLLKNTFFKSLIWRFYPIVYFHEKLIKPLKNGCEEFTGKDVSEDKCELFASKGTSSKLLVEDFT